MIVVKISGNSTKRVLLTGARGVLGQSFRTISAEYPQYEFRYSTSQDCDLRDMAATERFFRAEKPDIVLHLAAVSGGIALSVRHHASMLRDIALMTVSVLEAARKTGITKTIMTLTTGMYPVDAPLPLQEDSMHNGYPHESNYGSSFAKRLIDPAIRAYREEYGLPVIGLIPSGIFGEGDNFSPEDAAMVPALIRRFYDHKNDEEPITIWGDGAPLREYTYAPDLARIYLWAMENYDDAQCLNIGTTEENSVREIAEAIASLIGISPARLRFDTSKPSGIFRKSTDNARLLARFPFRYTPFRTGLERVIRWYDETRRSHPERLLGHPKLKAM